MDNTLKIVHSDNDCKDEQQIDHPQNYWRKNVIKSIILIPMLILSHSSYNNK